MKLKKGDEIIVIAGKDKGRKGKIEKVLPRLGAVLIPGINLVKKHLKPRGEGKPGGIIDVVKPILIPKVALVCPKCGKKTRIGYLITKDRKERVCKKCQAVI